MLEEAKDAYWMSMIAGQHTTFASYMTAAVAAYNERTREELNGGAPFPKRPSRNLPTNPLT
ncbi:hypothetical protein D5S17_23220 [Pseudonocardiaceae bacterium YIM PH 21723]|nr:hypothetical protein D5S17_23220 [Pseudonocardiaceae bacterium YIM PH 21723]